MSELTYVVRKWVKPEDLNQHGALFGGRLLQWVDEEAAIVAIRAAAAAPFSLAAMFFFFLKVGAVLFGTGYVLLAFLRADLVERWQWLTESQLLDAIAVGQITPGPLFTTATFIGYLLGGPVAGVFWMRMPPKGTPAMFEPLLLTVVFLMSNAAPSSMMPPAVLLLTLTFLRRRMLPPLAQTPGAPPVIDRSRMYISPPVTCTVAAVPLPVSVPLV